MPTIASCNFTSSISRAACKVNIKYPLTFHVKCLFTPSESISLEFTNISERKNQEFHYFSSIDCLEKRIHFHYLYLKIAPSFHLKFQTEFECLLANLCLFLQKRVPFTTPPLSSHHLLSFREFLLR